MSVQNPERVVTKQDLADFYQEILPYLGGSADAGFTPVGTVISVMGVTAPANYLACNGQVVNIADYPELANYFYQQFGSKNKFGGDGTTTFAVPDLRGEFLRGTGTNSHTGNGNGSAVGTHQDATSHRRIGVQKNSGSIITVQDTEFDWGASPNRDTNSTEKGDCYTVTSTIIQSTTSAKYYTARPTNTSVLYCIATKNIYLNPSLDYSTDEKVVGTWIDGKPLYQKTFTGNTNSTSETLTIPVGASVDNYISVESCFGIGMTYFGAFIATTNFSNYFRVRAKNNNELGPNMIEIITTQESWMGLPYIVTIRYTKTTS